MFRRPLTMNQKQRITNTLFWTVAAGAVATVALPSILPCPALDRNRQANSVYSDDEQAVHCTQRDDRTVVITDAKPDR